VQAVYLLQKENKELYLENLEIQKKYKQLKEEYHRLHSHLK